MLSPGLPNDDGLDRHRLQRILRFLFAGAATSAEGPCGTAPGWRRSRLVRRRSVRQRPGSAGRRRSCPGRSRRCPMSWRRPASSPRSTRPAARRRSAGRPGRQGGCATTGSLRRRRMCWFGRVARVPGTPIAVGCPTPQRREAEPDEDRRGRLHLVRGHDDVAVDHRLRRESGHGGAADVLDRQYGHTGGRHRVRVLSAQGLELFRPGRVVVDDGDHGDPL